MTVPRPGVAPADRTKTTGRTDPSGSTPVRRRALLAVVGTSLAAAGCLSESDGDGGGDGDDDSGTGTDPGTAAPPSVAATAFDDGEGDCGGDDAATVTVSDRTVVVAGRAMTPDPCHDLALAAADYDAGDDRLTVVVAVGDEGPGGCVECVGEVPYEARVTFDRGLPGTVIVRHRRNGETVLVARTSP